MTEASSLLPALPVSPKSPRDSVYSHSHHTSSQNGTPTSPTAPSSYLNNHSSHHHFHMPGHKKSQPVLSTGPPPPESRNLPPARPPKRPSTAGATPSPTKDSFSRQDQPPLPPLPSELRSPIPRPRTAAYDPSVPKEEREQRRLSAQVPPTTSFKRATRKLSLTSSMLGFGRKDKEKHKSAESPAALSPSLGTTSTLPGLSFGSRM